MMSVKLRPGTQLLYECIQLTTTTPLAYQVATFTLIALLISTMSETQNTTEYPDTTSTKLMQTILESKELL